MYIIMLFQQDEVYRWDCNSRTMAIAKTVSAGQGLSLRLSQQDKGYLWDYQGRLREVKERVLLLG